MVIDNQIFFDLDWIPIYNAEDFYKCKAMFLKCYEEYTKFIYNAFWTQPPKNCDEHITMFNDYNYTLNCTENKNLTLIELTLKSYETTLQCESNSSCISGETIAKHFQLCVGTHCVLNTETKLNLLPVHTVYFVISFILYKLSL